MGQAVLQSGCVLSAMPIGEYDKRLVLLTAGRGRITAFAAGARRPNSPLLASACPFVFGEFELYEGKSSYRIGKINVKNYFRELAADLDAAYYGFYFMELADYYAVENVEAKDMCNLLYASLRALGRDGIPDRLVRRVYELRMLAISGEYPCLDSCASCGSEEDLRTFCAARNGVLCGACAERYGGLPLGRSALYAMRYIVSAPLERLYGFRVSDAVQEQLDRAMDAYMSRLDRRFRSLELISGEGC